MLYVVVGVCLGFGCRRFFRFVFQDTKSERLLKTTANVDNITARKTPGVRDYYNNNYNSDMKYIGELREWNRATVGGSSFGLF